MNSEKTARIAQLLLPLLLGLALASPNAQAESPPAPRTDWRQAEMPDAQPLVISGFEPGRNGSLWTFTSSGVLHTSASGLTTTVHRGVSPVPPFNRYDSGVVQDDGGMLLQGPACQMQRVGAQLQPGTPLVRAGSCHIAGANAQGVIWAASGDNLAGTLSQLRSDGSIRFTVRPEPAAGRIDALIVDDEGSAYAAYTLPGPGGRRIARYDSSGRERWSKVMPAGEQQRLVLARDGGVFAANQAGSDVNLARLSAGGTMLWSRQLPVGKRVMQSVSPSSDGALYLITADAKDQVLAAREILRFQPEGSQAWARPICPGLETVTPLPVSIAVNASGQAAVLCSGVQPRVVRRDTRGNLAADLVLPLRSASLLRERGDGSLLILGQSADVPSRSRLLLLNNANQIIPSPLGDGPGDGSLIRLAQQIDSDGTVYLLSQAAPDARPATQILSKIAPGGMRLWTRQLPSMVVREARMSSAADRVCVHQQGVSANSLSGEESRGMFCLAAADGRTLWARELPAAQNGDPVFIKALDNGKTVIAQSNQLQHAIVAVSLDGSLETLIRNGTHPIQQAVVDDRGRTTISTATGLLQYDATGQRTYTIARSPLEELTSNLAAANDGSMVLAGRRGGAFDGIWLWSVNPDGSTRWLVPLDGKYRNPQIIRRDDAIYTVERDSPDGAPLPMTRLAADSGLTLWQRESGARWQQLGGSAVALSAAGDKLLLLRSQGNRLRLQRYASATGNDEEERILSCYKQCDEPAALALDAAGTARMVYSAEESNGYTTVAQAVSQATVTAPRIRLDQPGINGLWYSPYANGEGVTFDWIAGPRVLFGAWFTYSTAGGNSSSELRWYTVQSNDVPLNSTSLRLPILDTLGGNFDAGPPAAPRQVGSATLSFSDCDQGTLSYDFDDGYNDGVNGVISLSRLTPATEPCILADGSTRPGAGARPPQNGFDARMSGSWYDESSVGQGLHLNIQPGGVFFSPWFTYDPQGQGNDPDREHWFTLQGSLANAVDGSAEVLIAQSIGGAFDRVPTYNGYAVGKATVTLRDCGHARVEYRFDDDERAGAFRNRRGEMELVKIGGCGP